jgi:hypothetical protein
VKRRLFLKDVTDTEVQKHLGVDFFGHAIQKGELQSTGPGALPGETARKWILALCWLLCGLMAPSASAYYIDYYRLAVEMVENEYRSFR